MSAYIYKSDLAHIRGRAGELDINVRYQSSCRLGFLGLRIYCIIISCDDVA